MRRPYFRTAERQQLLEKAWEPWKGTPFFPNNASPGHGVGCVNLIHEGFVAAGAIERLALPNYDLDTGHHTTSFQLLDFFLNAPGLKGRFMFVPFLGPRLPGDLFAVLSGQIDHHLACARLWGKVIHAHSELGVITHDEKEKKFAERILYVLRLMEEV